MKATVFPKVMVSLVFALFAMGVVSLSSLGCGGGRHPGTGGGGAGGNGMGDSGPGGPDGAAGTDTGTDATGISDAATIWPPAVCTSPINGVSTAAFCATYYQKCAAQFGAGAGAYTGMADCLNSYPDFTANADPASTAAQNQKGCAAYHLCLASKSSPGDPTHCAHAAGGANNPCALPQ